VEEVAPTSLQVTVHPEPLMLMALVKSYHGTLVCAQMCPPQDGFKFSHVRLPSRVLRPFTDTPVYDMSLTHAERLCAMGCGLRGKLVQLLSMGASYLRYFEPQENWGACHRMMRSNVRRVASKLLAAERDKAAKQADELCASGQCAAALTPLKRAIYFGDFASLALQAWLILRGREGMEQNRDRGFELAEWGAQLGCHHCKGVVAFYYDFGYGCEEHRAFMLELATASSEMGSRYGQLMLGDLYMQGLRGLTLDQDQATALYRLAAAQGLDMAQNTLGSLYMHGKTVALDWEEALRWHMLAAVQGDPAGLYWVARCHEHGRGVPQNTDIAIHWLRRASAAGDEPSTKILRKLRKPRNPLEFLF
jgi:TPR repeat protein